MGGGTQLSLLPFSDQEAHMYQFIVFCQRRKRYLLWKNLEKKSWCLCVCGGYFSNIGGGSKSSFCLFVSVTKKVFQKDENLGTHYWLSLVIGLKLSLNLISVSHSKISR